MGCKCWTLGFPSASFPSSSSRYHVQMLLQIIVDTVIFPLFALQIPTIFGTLTLYVPFKTAVMNIFRKQLIKLLHSR